MPIYLKSKKALSLESNIILQNQTIDLDKGGVEMNYLRFNPYNFTREDVLKLIDSGLNDIEIATSLGISYEDFLRFKEQNLELDYKLPVTAGEIIAERRQGKYLKDIAHSLSYKKGVEITAGQISTYLKRNFTPRIRLADYNPPGMIHRGGAPEKYTIELIRNLRSEGCSWDDIDEDYDRISGVARTFVYRQGYSPSDFPRPTLTAIKSHNISLERIQQLVSEGKRGKELAAAMGCRYDAITSFIYRRNMTMSQLYGEPEYGSPQDRKAEFTAEDVLHLRTHGNNGKGMDVAQIIKTLKTSHVVFTRVMNEARINVVDIPIGEGPHISFEGIVDLRTKEGKTWSEIREHFASSYRKINQILSEQGKTKDDFPRGQKRSNPVELRRSAPVVLPASIGLGSSMAIAKVLDMKYPTMSGTKRSLIAGGVPASVSLGIYAKTKDEAALWGLAGSVIGTALSAYLFRK